MWEECKKIQDEIVAMRRDLHKIPELGTDLPKTRDYIIQKLEEYGISYKKSELDSGIVAEIKGNNPGKIIGLRADIDALPITEDTGVEYTSTHPGCMHACGHDAHCAMLLGAAKVLNENSDKFQGTVRLIFQTGEEIAKGASNMIKIGAIDNLDAIFGIHIGTIIDKDIPQGNFIITPGSSMASFDRFVIKVIGEGCHGSTPEKGIDPVNIAGHIILALQTINSREFNACVPVVLTIGSIHGGSQYNIIPSEVIIEGTIRTLDEKVRRKVSERIEEIAQSQALSFGGKVEYILDEGAPPVVNDINTTKIAQDAAIAVLGEDKVITKVDFPNMGGEDFAQYLLKIPGTFMFLSSSNPKLHTDISHHNPKFNIDESVLWEGSAVFVSIIEKMLTK